MLERFATILYLISFGIGFAIFLGLFFMGYGEYTSYGDITIIMKSSAVGLVCFMLSFFIGWSIRYILTGKKSII
jgi:hypothetical protein